MIRIGNPVALALTVGAGAAALTTGFVSEAPNRLISGQPLPLWHVASSGTFAGIALLGSVLLVTAFLPRRPAAAWSATAAAAALLLLLLHCAGAAAAALAIGASPAARTALGPAFWLMALAAALAIVDGLQRLGARPGTRLLVVAAIVGAIALMARAGAFDALSLLREYAARRGIFAEALAQHLRLVATTLIAAATIGVPLGVLAARRPRAKAAIFAVLNLVQTIPSIALFGLLIVPLSALAAAAPRLAAIGVHGIGFAPAVIALVLYALLPVVRNTEAAIAGVDPTVVEAAVGMGFTPAQILRRISLPLGLPVFLAGLRIVIVQAIGLAVIAALIGAGGLGIFVFQGLGQYAVDLVLLGALPTIGLALTADFVLRILVSLSERRRAR